MREHERLKEMLAPKIRRSLDLIVDEVTYEGTDGSLNNDHWHFRVPFAFRDALDIKYEERVKNKKKYRVWTQGPILRFDQGDILHSKDDKKIVQVRYASPAGWDSAKGAAFEGTVTFDEFEIPSNPGTPVKTGQQTMTQYEFLALLMYGEEVKYQPII